MSSYLYSLNDFRRNCGKEDVAYADETTYRVLNSNKESTVFWVFSNLSDSSTPLVISHHNETRKTAVSQDFLKGFTGYLPCDGYSVYSSLDGILPVRCLAHARRKFYETIPKTKTTSRWI